MGSSRIMGRLVSAALLALAVVAGDLAGQEQEAFTDERFAELQEQDALILLDVFASWCGTCARQQEVLAEYRARHPEVALHTLTIDFDERKDLVRRFAAPRQSTLILYRGDERIWFSVAESRREVIFAELNRAARRTPR